MKGLAAYVAVITALTTIVPCVAMLIDLKLSSVAMLIHPVIALFYLILAGAALTNKYNTSVVIMVWAIVSLLVLLSGVSYIVLTELAGFFSKKPDIWLNVGRWAGITLVFYLPLVILSVLVIVHAKKSIVTNKVDQTGATMSQLN